MLQGAGHAEKVDDKSNDSKNDSNKENVEENILKPPVNSETQPFKAEDRSVIQDAPILFARSKTIRRTLEKQMVRDHICELH